jgi:hypothetical protein
LQFEASLGKQFVRPYLKNPITKKGLVEWLKVKALSSSPSTKKKPLRPRRPKIVCSPLYADFRSRANTTRGLDFDHMMR